MAFDLVIIGGGPGGHTAAEHAAKRGLSTALVERDALGGTCLHRGCIPTKAYLHAAETVEKARVYSDEIEPDFGSMLARKDETVREIAEGLEQKMRKEGVSLYRGTATLLSAQPPFFVRVAEASGESYTLGAANVLIATGSAPARIPVEGCDHPGLWTSDDILGPKAAEPFGSLLIVGGGVIGVEMASVYARLGVQVTILEAEKNCLPMFDRELSRSAEALLKALNVAVLTGARLRSVTPDDSFIAVYERGGEMHSVSCERVLLCTGRKPVTDGLLGQGVELEMNGRFIAVNERFRTSIPGVYAVGDVNGVCPLAHAAAAQAISAVADIKGKPAPTSVTVIPSCVYTQPEIASVGLTQDEAKARGLDVIVSKALTTQNARMMIEGLGRGFVKLVFDKETRKLLGAQLLCGRATDMIGELSQAIALGLTAEQLVLAVRAHPTFEEAITQAAEGACQD